jgi:hypothetical protein
MHPTKLLIVNKASRWPSSGIHISKFPTIQNNKKKSSGG